MNKKIFFLCTFLLIIIPTSLVFAQNDNVTPNVDPEIIEELNKNSEVSVIVEVKDTSGIIITSEDSEEEQLIKDSLKKEFLENKTNVVLSKLPASEFKLRLKFQSGNGFSGNITLAGFNRLLNDTNVEMIWLNKPAYITPTIIVGEDQEIIELEPEEIKNDSNQKNFSTSEEEQKPEIIDEPPQLQEIEESEGKSLSLLWILIFTIALLIGIVIITKFRKDKIQ